MFILPLVFSLVQPPGVFVRHPRDNEAVQANEPTPPLYPLPQENLLITSSSGYPPPGEVESKPLIFQQTGNPLVVDEPKTFLPFIIKSPITTHFYAQAEKQGVFYGVWAIIETADPVIREPLFSYASINITGPGGHWIETGWIKKLVIGLCSKI